VLLSSPLNSDLFPVKNFVNYLCPGYQKLKSKRTILVACKQKARDMLRKLLLINIILIISQIGICQTTTLLDEGEPKTITIGYGKPENGNLTNSMIGLVSKTLATSPQQTKLEYKAIEYHKIIKNGSKLNLTLSLGNFQLVGDYNYKGFNINNQLIPTLINYTYNWSAPDEKVIESKSIKGENFKSGKELVKLTRNDTLSHTTYKIFFSSLSLSFDKNGLKQLDSYMKSVDGYYDADAHLNLMKQELDKVRTDTLELLETFRQLTLNNIKALNTIKSEHYVSKLNLDARDPIGFKSHLGQIEVLNHELKKKLEYTLDHLYEAYYFKGIDWLNWNDKAKAKIYFERSIASKLLYAPPHFELAKIDFESKNYQSALDTCSEIIAKMKPDTDTRYNTLRLAEKMITIYLDSVTSLINDKKFEPAFRKLDYCSSYTRKVEGIRTFAEFDQLFTQLYKAMYNELVISTDSLIKCENLELAHHNIDSLVSFRIRHEQFLLSNEKEQGLLKVLYTAWINKGTRFLNIQLPDSALYSFNKAYEICHTYEFVHCTDELDGLAQKARTGHYQRMLDQTQLTINEQLADSALALLQQAELYQAQYKLIRNPKTDTLFIAAKQTKYTGLIIEGDRAENQRHYREALAYYDEANQIENEVPVDKNAELPAKMQGSAKSYITFLCNQGLSMIEARQTSEAKTNLSTSLQLEEKYKLSNDEDVKRMIDRLKNALSEGICDELDFQYKIQISSANKFIDKKDFINAVNALNKASELLKNNSECNHSDSIVIRMKNEVGSMQSYQKEMLRIAQLMDQKNYKTGIDAYNRISTFYADSCKNNFEIVHKPLFEFIITGSNTGLIDFAIRYYSEQKDTKIALALLDELYNRNYDSNWSQKSQIMLGVQLALDDYRKDPTINASEKVLIYCKNNKWYNPLKKAYLQQWKKL